MTNAPEILAKSRNYGNLSLFDHTEQVMAAIVKFSEGFDHAFDTTIAVKGAMLHDLGKAHPHFQRKIKNINSYSLNEQRLYDYTHRHEISSLGFLPLFPKSEWDILIDLVIGHHKSIKNDARERGILDLIDNYSDTIANHLKDWEEWHLHGLEILKQFDFPIRVILKEEAIKAINYVVEYCENKKSGWSPLRGLLKSADHFASAFMQGTQSQLEPLFEKPDLTYYSKIERKSRLYPLSKVDANDNRSHTLVVAPTGAGKTDFLLRRCKGRVFYTLPFQASINAMWERIKKDVPNKDIRLLHATSRLVVGKQIEEQILQPLAGSSVKVLTPHQLAAIVFCTSGFESVMLDVQGCDVILDEIHTYNDYSQAMVLEIVKALKWLKCRIHIGTATMPSVLYKELLEILGGTEKVYEVKLTNEMLDEFDRHTVYKLDDETTINEILKSAFDAKEKVLVVYNTVGAAQKAFKKFKGDFPDVPMMLIHSRYRRSDRVILEHKLKKDFNGDETNEGLKPCLVVSTQVVEVSLDISFDRMITTCAPLDALIQRFGRVNRKRNEQTIRKYKPVHVIKPSGNSLPYKKEVIEDSFLQLPNDGERLKERTLQNKIDAVYPILNKKQIDVHLKFKHDKFLLTELTDNKKAVLVEALEIESASCILSCDRDNYETAKWEDRLGMEIPINYKTLARQKNKYEQLIVGAYPFVVPQSEEEHKLYGLELVEHESII
jgi:CRISPR-associated endonuclease/helicase Cas3